MQKRTIYTLPKDTQIDGKTIANLITLHKKDVATYAILESYIDDEPTSQREAPNEILAVHNFAEYIRDTNVGYLLGNSVDYKASDESKLDTIVEKYSEQSISELDTDLAEDLSMYGQAFENIYVDENTEVLSAKLSAFNTIVVYDDTFKHNKMFAVYYSPLVDSKGVLSKDSYDVTIWTDTKIMERTLNKETLSGEETNDDIHTFGEVPVVHYMNNKRMKGDYESVISLIDAYNILQSDRVLDREKLVDAILAFYGASMTPEDMKSLKEHRTIGLPPNSKAEYLIKEIDEADADVLRKTIAADIHKFSKTPDFTDEKFGNAPSGVSLKYKILSLEWNAQKKEQHFAAGLKDRFRMYVEVLKLASKLSDTINVSKVEAVFKRSLPKNDLETSQMINNLDSIVDQETLVGQLSFVKDASKVVEKTKEEREESLANNNFGTNLPTDEEE